MNIPAKVYQDEVEGLPLIVLKRFTKGIDFSKMREELIILGFTEAEARFGKFAKDPGNGEFVGAIMLTTREHNRNNERSKFAS